MKKTLLALFMGLNLSYAAFGGLNHDADGVEFPHNVLLDGSRSLDRTFARTDFDTPKEPIPYSEIWDNGLKQTPMNYVVIMSILQRKATDQYKIITRLRRDYLRLRDKIILEDMEKRWK